MNSFIYKRVVIVVAIAFWLYAVLLPRPVPGGYGRDIGYGFPFCFGATQSDVRTTNLLNILNISRGFKPMSLIMDMVIWGIPAAAAVLLLLWHHKRRNTALYKIACEKEQVNDLPTTPG